MILSRALSRRHFLRLFAAGFVVPGLSRTARALDYPMRPVRIIEGFGAGSTPDLISRLIGQWLSEQLGQPFIVENRTGAGSNIATEAVVTAPADGYTLLACLTANAINASLYEKLDFNFLRDITPVAGLIRFPMVLLVNPSFPANSFVEFIAYARANPGKIDVASPGVGTPMHVSIELLKMMAGIDIVHVPYRGPAAAMTDLIGGQVQAFVVTVSTAIGFIKSGKVRPLAVTSATRSEALPDIPSVGEVLRGFDAISWNGVAAPAGTPAPVVEKLSKHIIAGLTDAQLKARLKDLGGETVPMPSAEFAKFIAGETEKWAKVVKFAGAKAN
jgi:tripartite-type tricarboxylate transporter receptor subunit TctC